jgi:hypothetical protein
MSREKSTGAAVAIGIGARTPNHSASPTAARHPEGPVHWQTEDLGWRAGLGLLVVRWMRAIAGLIEPKKCDRIDSKRRLQSVKFC